MASAPQFRRRRSALLAILVGTACLSLRSLLAPRLWEYAHVVENGALSLEEEMDMHFRRSMLLIDDEDEDEDATVFAVPGEDDLDPNGDSNIEDEEAVVPYSTLIDDGLPLPPYTIQDAVGASRLFDHTFALLVYDPDEDTFLGLYSRRHYWVTGCDKLMASFKHAAFFLRKNFPERFQGQGSDELVIPISSGDYPAVKAACLDYFRNEASDPLTPPGWRILMSRGCDAAAAPILHFGSVFRRPQLFPSMIAMPMPEPHNLYCFEAWATHGNVCRQMRVGGHEEDPRAEMVYGEELGLAWDDLIPQVVWRGTDFSYLSKAHPSLQKPQFREELTSWPLQSQTTAEKRTKEIGGGLTAVQAVKKKRRLERLRERAPLRAQKSQERLVAFSKAAAVQSLREQYDGLLPRWKALVLTAEAEVEAIGLGGAPDQLPWANMKISRFVDGGSKTQTAGAEHYREWEEIGFATGNYMSKAELAQYKYHIDLGGGGGTTWTGTIHKLAMPGLLFHHTTPTKDYIHDWMKPWTHYIPVKASLRDLRRKFDWAEAHPEESRKIAAEGTKLMRYLTSPEGYGAMYERNIVEPLRRAVEAYQPVKSVHGSTSWRTWREALRQIEGDDGLVPVVRCSGTTVRSCEQMLGKNHLQRTLTHRNAGKAYIPGNFT